MSVVDALVPNPSWGRTFRFIASWSGEGAQSEYEGPVGLSIRTDISGCSLDTTPCSVGSSNYQRIRRSKLNTILAHANGPDNTTVALEDWEELAAPLLSWTSNATTHACSAAQMTQTFFDGVGYLQPNATEPAVCETFSHE